MVKGRKIDFPVNIATSGALDLDHRYGHLDAGDLAFAIECIKGAGQTPSDAIVKACAMKSFDAVEKGRMEAKAIGGLKALGVKADELLGSDVSGLWPGMGSHDLRQRVVAQVAPG